MYVIPVVFTLVWAALGLDPSHGALLGMGTWFAAFTLWFLAKHLLGPFIGWIVSLDIGNPAKNHEDIGEQPER